MNPTLIMMAVQAAIRLGRAGSEAFGQYARDRDVLLPLVNKVPFPKRDMVRGFFEIPGNTLPQELQPYWDSFIGKPGAPARADALDLLSAEYARQQAPNDPKSAALADEYTGLWLVTQWAKGAEPPGPFARVVLTIVDVAAEFAATDPTLFGVNGNGEVLVKALATRIAELVPDDANSLGPKNVFGERVAAIFLKAGLGALAEHPESVVDDVHVQKLVANTLPVLVQKLPNELGAQMKWRDVVETILGPVAGAALRTVAQSPQTFLGKRFLDDELLGTLTKTWLLKVADVGLGNIVTRAGAVQLYQATLQLAAAQPELFIGKPQDASDKLVSAVFADLARVAASSPTFDRALISDLAAGVLDTLAREGGTLLDPAKPWDGVVSQLLSPVLTAVAGAVRTGNSAALRRLGSRANIEAMLRVVVTQVAATPSMLPSTDNAEIDRLVAAVVDAMAQDEHLLLSQDDWIAILTAAAQEVAANPGRLLGVGRNATGNLLAGLLGDTLAVASEKWRSAGRAGGAVLFGSTLREAAIVTIRAYASHSAAAALNSAKVKAFVAQLCDVVSAQAAKYGGKEWLFLYRALILQVVESGEVPALGEREIENALGAVGAGT